MEYVLSRLCTLLWSTFCQFCVFSYGVHSVNFVRSVMECTFALSIQRGVAPRLKAK
jgi:hypothetical protein